MNINSARYGNNALWSPHDAESAKDGRKSLYAWDIRVLLIPFALARPGGRDGTTVVVAKSRLVDISQHYNYRSKL